MKQIAFFLACLFLFMFDCACTKIEIEGMQAESVMVEGLTVTAKNSLTTVQTMVHPAVYLDDEEAVDSTDASGVRDIHILSVKFKEQCSKVSKGHFIAQNVDIFQNSYEIKLTTDEREDFCSICFAVEIPYLNETRVPVFIRSDLLSVETIAIDQDREHKEKYSTFTLNFKFDVIVNGQSAGEINCIKKVAVANQPIIFDATVEGWEPVEGSV